MSKKAVVIFSGGMDSTICLKLAVEEYGKDSVSALSFKYGQRHIFELEVAAKVAKEFGVDHKIFEIPNLDELTENSLIDPSLEISTNYSGVVSTFVMGRNGLFGRLGAIYAHSLGANEIWMGVLEREESNSGYPDCSREYMNKLESVLKIDLFNEKFSIRTPLVFMDKAEEFFLAEDLGILELIKNTTVTCYNGVPGKGCLKCPSCVLKGKGHDSYLAIKSLNNR